MTRWLNLPSLPSLSKFPAAPPSSFWTLWMRIMSWKVIFFGDRMDFQACDIRGASAISPLLHPKPKHAEFWRGKCLPAVEIIPPSCHTSKQFLFSNGFNMGKACMRFGESKPRGSRRNSRGASVFPLLSQCLEQQISLSCALGLIRRTPNV